MFKTRLVLMIVLAAFVMAPVQAVIWSDSLGNITGYADDRDGSSQGIGWMSAGTDPLNGAIGTLQVDYSNTYDRQGVAPYNQSHPSAGNDRFGAWTGSISTGAFATDGSVSGQWWDSVITAPGYLGDMDRVASKDYSGGGNPVPPLWTTYQLEVEVWKEVGGNSEHLRQIQLYDSSGFRSIYNVSTSDIFSSPTDAGSGVQGWTIYTTAALGSPAAPQEERNANLGDIEIIKLYTSAWAQTALNSSPNWPTGYTFPPQTGTSVHVKNLNIIPEPATMIMLSLGGLALLRRRKK